jgi:hypothetical protein
LAELKPLPRDAIRQVFLFSDGNPTSGITDWLQIRNKIAEQTREGQVVSVFAYGSDANLPELDKLAGLTGGSTTNVLQPGDVLPALQGQLNRRAQVAAMNVQLKLDIDDDVRIVHFFGHDLVTDPVQRAAIDREVEESKQEVKKRFGMEAGADIYDAEEGIRLAVPNLAVGETYWITLELVVPEGRKAPDLGSVLVQYTDTFVRQNESLSFRLTPTGRIPSNQVPIHALALAESEQVWVWQMESIH